MFIAGVLAVRSRYACIGTPSEWPMLKLRVLLCILFYKVRDALERFVFSIPVSVSTCLSSMFVAGSKFGTLCVWHASFCVHAFPSLFAARLKFRTLCIWHSCFCVGFKCGSGLPH